ncbi:pentapeptide repeat-containing protein [Paenibacillus sp. N1-5-1-14]|uniref:pentapeptide repeat-containing protein n=1 Tax=Paenibacillus radicibacter TaxID=2972488 RepID=UPI00215982B4|nr:pentapeptide repeat-containing protein [Paenibacillus radicibacter]MCR8645455.1 pentapeptide repeat-containing protein [Paenibacillus radicibacter]
MNQKLTNYLNGVFTPYDGVKSVTELKADLLSDLQERYSELRAEGKDDDTAFKMTIDSIGDIEETILEVSNLSRSLERQVQINLSAIDLQKSDFAGVTMHKGKFKSSALRGADFTGADLTGSLFATSDACEAKFDGANLTDCNLSTLDLTNANFNKSILVRTHFNMSGLDGVKFKDIKLIDVTITKTDLRKTIFINCHFNGVNFSVCDLRGMHLDGMSFTGVKFDKSALNDVSFRGATLKNVSFRLPFSVTNKSYREFKTVSFDGATMDKLTYAGLKGLYVVDLSKVTVI